MQGRVIRRGFGAESAEERDFFKLFQPEQTRAHAVVDVVRVVRYFIGQIGQLCFEPRLYPARRIPAFGGGRRDKAARHPAGFAQRNALSIAPRAVLQDTLARLERQVQTVKARVTFLQRIDDAKALHVVLKTSAGGVECSQADMQCVLASVAEWRVAQVMRQGDGLNQIFVEIQTAGDGPAELRHLKRMRQPGAKQIALMIQKDLGFINKAAKRGAMHDAVAVALKLGARWRWRFGKPSAARPRRVAGVRGLGHRTRVNALVF